MQAGTKSWGAHAPPRVVSDALVGNRVEWFERPVFGEGAKDNTRGRVCSPRMLRPSIRIRYSEILDTLAGMNFVEMPFPATMSARRSG